MTGMLVVPAAEILRRTPEGQRPPLSRRQRQALQAIRTHLRQYGRAPLRAELGATLGITPMAAHDLVRVLAGKRYVALVPNTPRGIRLLNAVPPPSSPDEDVTPAAPVRGRPRREDLGAAIDRLDGYRLSAAVVAARLGVSERTVQRRRAARRDTETAVAS